MGVGPIKPNRDQLLHLESQQPNMETYSKDLVRVTFMSLSLLLFKCEAQAASKQLQATVYNTGNDNLSLCHDGFMSVYISKGRFADLPVTIYVQGESDSENYILT